MDRIKKIISEIKKGNIKPIYFLMGEEAYYIDAISSYIENNVLKEEEKGFNQMVLYGRDISIEDIVSNAKRFPMMAEKQVVIIKEAQDLSRTIENLTSYIENPQPTTVLVVCYKYKTLDKRKKLAKIIAKNGVLFESKKLYENQIPDWIRRVLNGKKYQIEPKAALMLVEFLGSNLAKINNELQKLMLVLPTNSTITANDIETNIGISKDYNNFELRKAIGAKKITRVNQIITYFSQNQKSNPLIMTISLLTNYFIQILMLHSLSDKSKPSIAKALKISPYFVGEYIEGAKNYSMKKVAQIISYLREADVKSKGVGANALPAGDILKELIFKIMN